jgi:hypothetical protein
VVAGFEGEEGVLVEGVLVDVIMSLGQNGIGQQHPATVISINIDIASIAPSLRLILMFSVSTGSNFSRQAGPWGRGTLLCILAV